MLVNFWTSALIIFSFHSASLAGFSEFPAASTEKILISISEGNLNLFPQAGLKSIKLKVTDGVENEFAPDLSERIFKLRSKDQHMKTGFARKTKLKKELDLYFPQHIALEVHVLEGSIAAQKLAKDAFLHVNKGKITVKDSQSNLVLHQQKGEMILSEITGKVTLDSQAATVSLKGIKGDIDLQNFSGDSVIEKAKGFISLSTGSGSNKIVESSGNIQFESAKGLISIQKFLGRVEGQNQEASINISTLTEGDISIKSQGGRISISTPEGAGAQINLATVEGDLFVPNYLKINRESSQKSIRGRLRGETGKNNIFVRSQTGSISIK